MDEQFAYWIKRNHLKLEKMGVKQIEFRVSTSSEEITNPSITVEHSSDNCIGSITVWKSGFMDIEILYIETGKQILWEHRELTGNPNFSEILKNYFKIMISPNLNSSG